MLLVQGFAVVGVLAAADLGTPSFQHETEPVGVGEALTRSADDIGLVIGGEKEALLRTLIRR